jgi:hypothetical protein
MRDGNPEGKSELERLVQESKAKGFDLMPGGGEARLIAGYAVSGWWCAIDRRLVGAACLSSRLSWN